MRPLTTSEQRTVRIAGAGIGVYLLLFIGWGVWAPVRKHTADYEALAARAKLMEQQVKPYEDRALVTKKLMDYYQLDPGKLNRATVIGLASQEIQKTAAGCGIQVGPIRESATKKGAREMATLQFEGAGPIPGVLGLLKRMETLGYPLIIDSVQLAPNENRPDQIKLNLTFVILDFDQWKMEGASHA